MNQTMCMKGIEKGLRKGLRRGDRKDGTKDGGTKGRFESENEDDRLANQARFIVPEGNISTATAAEAGGITALAA